MFNEVIQLVSVTQTVNEYGDLVSVESDRRVYAEVASVGMKEFYQASAVGLKPEIKFILSDWLDYRGEQLVRYKPYNAPEQTFTVSRTYRNGLRLEITCTRGVDK